MPQKNFIVVLCTLLALFSVKAWGASVRKYDADRGLLWLQELNARALEIQQQVCVYSGRELVGCGPIVGLTRKAASVRIDEMHLTPQPGMVVQVKSQDGRGISSTEAVKDTFNTSSTRSAAISAGLSAGLNYFYPMMHLQLALGRDFSLGVMPLYASYSANDASTTGYGGYLTASYYYTNSVFRGLEFEAGVGYIDIKARNGRVEEKGNGLAGKFTVGWRGRALWDLGLDLGVAGGFQYISYQAKYLDISFTGLLPLVSAYIGYSF